MIFKCQHPTNALYTVNHLYSGHNWDPAGCPVYRGVLNSEVDLHTALCRWDCRQRRHLRGVFYREVPLYQVHAV